MRSRLKIRLAAAGALLALGVAACGNDGDTGGAAAADVTNQVAADTPAADLRAALTGLLSEHVSLAASATGAALRGDNASFEAYAQALNGDTNSNTADLVAGVSAAYGAEVGTAFEGLWRSDKHIPAFVAYTKAVAAGDAAGQDKAVADLLAYARTFAETLNSVNENLPVEAVEEGVKMHATTLKAVVDAQHAGDHTAAYANLRQAYGHMAHLAEALASATAAKVPAVSGDPDSNASDLRSGLTLLLREHVLLAAAATDAALDGRDEEFAAAARALNGPESSNTADLSAAVGSVYGQEIGSAFDGLWRSDKHIPAFVAYTKAVASGDQAAQEAAVADLVGYARAFAETMNSVNSNLPVAAVEEEVKLHASTLGAVIRAQHAGDAAKAAVLTREAAHHMNGTATALATATAAAKPDAFTS